MTDDRLAHLVRFYSLLDRLEAAIGGARTLAACSGRMEWPRRGVYFFREHGEMRSDTGTGPRIVRVGTHAISGTSDRTLWERLKQHKGRQRTGGGDHRASVFRRIVGTALLNRDRGICVSWGDKSASKRSVKADERTTECAVSRYISEMPFIWIAIGDDPGRNSLRGFVERNSVALLSNFEKSGIDRPSPQWLGLHCQSERLKEGGRRIRESGLWNSNHVDEKYDAAFLNELETLIAAAGDRA